MIKILNMYILNISVTDTHSIEILHCALATIDFPGVMFSGRRNIRFWQIENLAIFYIGDHFVAVIQSSITFQKVARKRNFTKKYPTILLVRSAN